MLEVLETNGPAVLSFLFNFYLYALFSTEYRLAFLALMGCWKQRSPGGTDESPAQLPSNGRLVHRASRTLRVYHQNGHHDYEKGNATEKSPLEGNRIEDIAT